MQIVEYAKTHPWATGIVVVVGGIIFLSLTGVFGGSSGGSSGGGDSSRPSDAEIAANAQIQAAQIAAQANAAQAGAAIQAAQIGAGVQLNSDNKAAEVAMRQLEMQEKLGISSIEGQVSMIEAQANADVMRTQSLVGGLSTLKSKQRGSALEAIATGQRIQNTPNYSNSAAGIIGSIGQAAGAILPFFSDQRLKENIRLIGRAPEGYGVYEFNYKGSNRVRRGVIADDVERHIPEAVTTDPRTGYKKVNPRYIKQRDLLAIMG